MENEIVVPASVPETIEVQVAVDVSDTASAKNAEAWAVGQRGGVDVPSTDPTYHNNAKYYAQQTAADASASAGARAGAEAAMTGATQQAQQAAGHEAAAAAAQTAAEEAAQEAIDTVVAAQGPGIVYLDEEGAFFILEEEEE